MDVLIAIDALDDMVHQSALVPLTGEAMLDPAEAIAAVRRIREALLTEHPGATEAFAGELEQLERRVSEAKPVPLSSLVRVRREDVFDALDRLRTELPEAIRRERLAQQVETEDRSAAERPPTAVTMEDAAARFSELAHRARFASERFVVEMDGVPMVEIRAAEERPPPA